MSTAFTLETSPFTAFCTAPITAESDTPLTTILVPSGSAPSGALTDTLTPLADPLKDAAGYSVSSVSSSVSSSSASASSVTVSSVSSGALAFSRSSCSWPDASFWPVST